MQAPNIVALPDFQPSPAEQARYEAERNALVRAREYAATTVLREMGATWADVSSILEMYWPQSDGPRYLNAWAETSLDRLNRNARIR